MTTIRAHESFVPFTLPLHEDGHVGVLEDLLSLRFNFHMGTMYIEQEMYFADGQVCEIIMIQKNRTEDGSMWILGPGSFTVIGLSKSQMQASTIVLINQSGSSTIQMQMLQILNWSLMIIMCVSYHILMINICITIHLSDTSSFPFRNTPFQVPLHASKSSYNPLYKKFVCHNTPFQHRSLYPTPAFIGLTIIDALKFTKYRKMSKSDLTAIDFENIVVRKVKYLPFSFNGDILFVLPLVPLGVSSAYGRSMDGMDKMCDGHPWCTTKTTNI